MRLGSFVTPPTPWPMEKALVPAVNTQLYTIALQWLREDRTHRHELEKEGRKVRGARRDEVRLAYLGVLGAQTLTRVRQVPGDSETFYRK